MPEWTKEQEAAINARNCDLLVSAAAGSGKTAVLSERVLKRITDSDNPTRVDRLLIVTFTEAAAAEMRQRIVDKLREEMIKCPGNRYLAQQLALVPKANITTIHSFCLNLIKSNFHLLDMDPGFGILDPIEGELIKIRLAQETINRMYQQENQAFSHVAMWLANGNDEELARVILKLYEYISSFESPLGWLREQAEKYNVSSDDIEDLPWSELLKTKYRVKLTSLLKMYDKAEKYSDEGGVRKYIDVINSDRAYISGILAACAGSWEDIAKAAENENFATMRADKDCDKILAEKAKKIRDTIKDKVRECTAEIKTITGSNAAESVKKAYPLMCRLVKTIELFDQLYTAEKREKNLIDFNDFEHIALMLLQNDSLPVAEEFREKFDEIYVDEYQDCNGVQEAIFYAIARKAEGKSCNMFMVGDIKQSIYKFRQADPSIFIGKLESYGSVGNRQKIMLNKNFRSRPEVVDFVNNLFYKIMSKHIGDIEYTKEEALDAQFPYPEQEGALYGGNPELIAVSDGTWEEDVEKISLEARIVACKIKSMVGSFCVYDAKLGKYRPSTYRDFAVLIRNTKDKIEYIEDEFKSYGIPFFSDKGKGLFQTHETELLKAALAITDNPLQDIPLLSFMRSVPGGFDEDMLLTVRNCHKKGYFYKAVEACAKCENEVAEKCRNFIEMLSEWRELSKVMPLTGLIEKIIDDTALMAYVQTLPGGKNRRANIEMFKEIARRFENSDLKGLFAFMRYIEKVEKGSGSETAKTLSESCDVVRIMTVHKSKGLEFPVVFLMDSNGKFNDRAWTRESLLLHKQYGIGCEYLDINKKIHYPLVSKKAIAYRMKLDAWSEEMRVLYVALTRAREKLFVTASGNSAIKKIEQAVENAENKHASDYEVENAASYLDWILMGLYGAGEKAELKITLLEPDDIELTLAEEEVTARAENKRQVTPGEKAELVRRLSYEYKHIAASGLSSKYSVTEIKQRFSNEAEGGTPLVIHREELIPGFMKTQKMSNAQIGTIMHLVLRFVDFNSESPKKAIEECIAYLLKNSFITADEAAAVKTDVLLKFMRSDICERMKNAQLLYREIPFNISVGGDVPTGDATLKEDKVLLQGIIDCLFVEGDKCYIIDYKTESKHYTDRQLGELYRRQLELYRVAAQQITGKEVEGTYLYFLNRGSLYRVK